MSSVTIVTCFYKVKSKHPFEKYDKWITNFLKNINCNLVVFTSPNLINYILSNRKNFLNKTVVMYQIFDELEINQKYSDFWDIQEHLDPDKGCGRNRNCYILWNSKLWFMKKAIELNPFNSDKFVWTDIGCLRDNNIIKRVINYPIYEKISTGKIDITLLQEIKDQTQEYFFNEIHFSGAMFGSDKETIMKFHDMFYEKLDKFIKEGKFIGCDQQTFSSVYNEERNLFNTLNPCNILVDKWFYLWQYYTS
jgi:hypothetical protein